MYETSKCMESENVWSKIIIKGAVCIFASWYLEAYLFHVDLMPFTFGFTDPINAAYSCRPNRLIN